MRSSPVANIILPQEWRTCFETKEMEKLVEMSLLTLLRTAELRFGDFLVPWGLVIGTLGFLSAWLIVSVMERLGWTRSVWHLPLFFVALATFLGCIFGLIFAP
jgi:Protein of unknown function (DUF1656)